MLFDKYISKQNKLYIVMLAASIWIYFRTFECYKLLPRKNEFSIFFVILWIYLYNKDTLFLPIGLGIMFLYSMF